MDVNLKLDVKEKLPRAVRPDDLRLADVVELFDGEFSSAIVRQITADRVTLVRPYMAHDDFSYTGGVITYIGTEEVTLCVADTRTVTLLKRGGPLK